MLALVPVKRWRSLHGKEKRYWRRRTARAHEVLEKVLGVRVKTKYTQMLKRKSNILMQINVR